METRLRRHPLAACWPAGGARRRRSRRHRHRPDRAEGGGSGAEGHGCRPFRHRPPSPPSPAAASGAWSRPTTSSTASSRRRRATWAARRATRPTRRSRAGVTGHTEVVQVVYDPSEGQLREAARRVLAQHRSDGEGPPVLRHRHAVPHRRSSSTTRRSGRQPRRRRPRSQKSKPFKEDDRHADRAGDRVLAGRGLPPGLLPEESGALQLLPQRLRARRAAQAVVGRGAGGGK